MAHAFLTALNPPQVVQWCTKVAHPSRKVAQKTVRPKKPHAGLVQAGTGKCNAYKCKICGGWHTGSLPGKGK
jgi:hypothetical protein